MTGTELATYVRQKTKTNSTTLTDAQIVALANPIKDEMAGEIIKVNEDYFGIFQTRNLEAGKRNYAFPTDMLSQMKYIEAKIDGTEWERLTEVEVQQLGFVTGNEDSIQEYFDGRNPSFEIFGNELIIYSGDAIIDVTDGLKLWSIIYPANLTTAMLSGSTDLSVPPSTTSFGFPRQFHKLLADKIVIEWKESQDKAVALTQSELLVDRRMMQALGSIKNMNLDRPHISSMPYDSGHDY